MNDIPRINEIQELPVDARQTAEAQKAKSTDSFHNPIEYEDRI